MGQDNSQEAIADLQRRVAELEAQAVQQRPAIQPAQKTCAYTCYECGRGFNSLWGLLFGHKCNGA